jgi:hypothetical protein
MIYTIGEVQQKRPLVPRNELYQKEIIRLVAFRQLRSEIGGKVFSRGSNDPFLYHFVADRHGSKFYRSSDMRIRWSYEEVESLTRSDE